MPITIMPTLSTDESVALRQLRTAGEALATAMKACADIGLEAELRLDGPNGRFSLGSIYRRERLDITDEPK